ncbi:MAG: prepilin-type N-terminal cleavage/methylation domain-containing protein [Fibrobacter sp.]|nr:prepilin-type N-terminal cleavage/methylation domain-containing protein [Fibrobacter sp.]
MKKGFTLMELMVYIAIVGIVVIVAGQAFSNSTKMRVRTQSMLKASEVAENVATLFKEDVAQTGAKSAMEAGTTDNGNNFGAVHASVYMNPSSSSNADSSSFLISTNSNQSDLTIRRMRYDANGHYQAVEEVRWYVNQGKLIRSCKLVEKDASLTVTDDDPCGKVNEAAKEVEMAEGVATFTVEAAKPGAEVASEQVFPASDAGGAFNFVSRSGDLKYVELTTKSTATNELKVGGTSITLSDFISNYDNGTQNIVDETNRKLNQVFAMENVTLGGTETWATACKKINLEAGQEYEISFNIGALGGTTSDATVARSLSFVPGVDHMSIGFRSASTGDFPRKDGVKLIDDFLFFPPLDASSGGKRSMRFSVSQNIPDVCLAFTFACYSPLVHQGKLKIENLKLKKVAGANYKFEDGYSPESHKGDKKNIKALKLTLKIERNGEGGGGEIVVPIPSNGPSD